MTDWIFNVWGQRWERTAARQRGAKNVRRWMAFDDSCGIVLEGGSINVNRKNTTHHRVVPAPPTRPHLNREQIESYLADYLAATNVIGLQKALSATTRRTYRRPCAFCKPDDDRLRRRRKSKRRKLCSAEKNFELKIQKTRDGNPFTVVPSPRPCPDKRRRSYEVRLFPRATRIHIANNVVCFRVRSTHRHTSDRDYGNLFLDRKIIPVILATSSERRGGIHCVTQQHRVTSASSPDALSAALTTSSSLSLSTPSPYLAHRCFLRLLLQIEKHRARFPITLESMFHSFQIPDGILSSSLSLRQLNGRIHVVIRPVDRGSMLWRNRASDSVYKMCGSDQIKQRMRRRLLFGNRSASRKPCGNLLDFLCLFRTHLSFHRSSVRHGALLFIVACTLRISSRRCCARRSVETRCISVSCILGTLRRRSSMRTRSSV